MPYYIYRVTPVGPIRQLAKITQFDAFKEASNEAKRLRRESDLAAGELIKGDTTTLEDINVIAALAASGED